MVENEHKEMQEKLKHSTAILNSILEGPENIIAFSLDCNYQYIFFNQAHKQTMKNIWGVDIETGQSMLDYISYPQDREKAKINFDRALSGENFIEIAEYGEEALSRNYWENIYNPIQIDNKIMGFTVFCMDITERHKAEEALKESEEKYRNIFENVQDMFYQTDINGKIIEISPSIQRYSKFHREDLIGKSVDIIYKNPEDRKKLLKAIQENGEVNDYELTLKDKNEQIIYVSVNAHFIFDSHNHPIGVEGSLRDITKRKKIEEDLKISQVHLADVMELAYLANWELDLPNQVFIFNDKFYAMLGTTREDEGGYTMPIVEYVKKYVHPDDASFIAEGMRRSIESREPAFGVKLEHRIIRRDGETRYLAIHIRIIPSSESHGPYVYGAVQDITDHKVAEENLKESLNEKEMLLKEIHHRVKNNLMVISSLLNIQSRYIKDKAALDVFRESQNRAKSMALIHEKLYRSTDLKNIDFGEYIRTFATELYHSIVADPSLIKLNLNAESVMLDINTSIPLGLIVNELITNSLKHAFPEGTKGEINVDFGHDNGTFVLSVADNGKGFPEDMDFRKTDSLGLQLVNSLTEQIDGILELDKTQGTQFKVIFKEIEFSK
jgi:PAS domain S-box-containing protein